MLGLLSPKAQVANTSKALGRIAFFYPLGTLFLPGGSTELLAPS